MERIKLVICAWCEPRQGLFSFVSASHTICPRHLDSWRKELADKKRAVVASQNPRIRNYGGEGAERTTRQINY